MVDLNMHGAIKLSHQGRLKCPSLLSAETNQMANRGAPHHETLMRLWSRFIMAKVLCSHDECDCLAIENRIKNSLQSTPLFAAHQQAHIVPSHLFFTLSLLSCSLPLYSLI